MQGRGSVVRHPHQISQRPTHPRTGRGEDEGGTIWGRNEDKSLLNGTVYMDRRGRKEGRNVATAAGYTHSFMRAQKGTTLVDKRCKR